MGRLFGTDGVRGIANRELSTEQAMRLGRAAALVLGKALDRKPLFLIGFDTRASSPMLCAAVAAGVCSAGADAIVLGVVPTPAVAFLVTHHGASAGVMISASHNPSAYNGIKIFGGEGYKLPDELEQEIEDLVLDQAPSDLPTDGEIGTIRIRHDSLAPYLAHIASAAETDLCGLSVAIDCANGSASDCAEKLFTALGANVHMLHQAPNGTNINAACGSTNMEELAQYVVKNRLDCGLAFDGDADRFLAIDENGATVDGDRIMAICALDMKSQGKLPQNTVVGTVMTNFGFTRFCDENGIRFIATKVGDRFVLEEMLLGGYALGGEQSGHVIFREFSTTGDGQLTALRLLSIMKKQQTSLSTLATVMTQYPQYTENLTVSPEGRLAFFTDLEIKSAIDSARELLGDAGRVVVRPSGTEPLIRVMAESMDDRLARAAVDSIAATIRRRLGKDRV